MRYLPLLVLVSCATAPKAPAGPTAEAALPAAAAAPARTWRQPKAVVIRHGDARHGTGDR